MRNTCSICGSYAINIDKAGLLCDVHFYKVQRDELLEALRDMVRNADDEGWEAPQKARAAIAKAEGATA